jgi:hypothetical protein
MDKFTALEVVRTALASYIQDCSGNGTEETKQIEAAYQVVKKAIFKK